MRLETRETHNSSVLHNSVDEILQQENSTQNEGFLLKSIYFKERNNYISWLKNRNFSNGYYKQIINITDKLFETSFDSIKGLKIFLNVEVKNRKYYVLAFRNWLKFCDEYELIRTEIISDFQNRVKVKEKSNIDTYIPNEDDILFFVGKVKEYDYLSYVFVKILLDSGLRISEVSIFLKNLDKSKFEIYNNIVVYPLYYLRGTKSAYYLFISKETYKLILDNFDNLLDYNVEKLKTWIKRNELISLKYTRKYNFTKLIKSGVSFEMANFIQGRVSQNIGFNHYLAKKEIAIKEYGKLR